MFGVIGWIALGFMLALLTRLIARIKDPDGTLVSVLIGVAGGVMGGLLSVAIGSTSVDHPAAFFAALAGAVTALALKTWTVKYEQRTRV